MLIHTTEGEIDESLLVKAEGVVDNDDERTTWVEYRRHGIVVHRSVHVTLKRGVEGVPSLPHLDVDAWARGLIERLVEQRKATGQPVEFEGQFTAAEQAALRRAIAGVGSLEEVHA